MKTKNKKYTNKKYTNKKQKQFGKKPARRPYKTILEQTEEREKQREKELWKMQKQKQEKDKLKREIESYIMKKYKAMMKPKGKRFVERYLVMNKKEVEQLLFRDIVEILFELKKHRMAVYYVPKYKAFKMLKSWRDEPKFLDISKEQWRAMVQEQMRMEMAQEEERQLNMEKQKAKAMKKAGQLEEIWGGDNGTNENN